MIKLEKCTCLIIIIVLTVAVYIVSVNNEFVNWDDDGMVVNNTTIRSLSINNIKNIFTPHFGSSYQPLRVLSYAIDYAIDEMNPVVYHIHSILLHILASIFLFLSLLKSLPQLINSNNIYANTAYFTGKKNDISQIILFTAFFSTILFAIHPVNVEAVTWLSDRKYPLVSCFSFLSFYLYTLISDGKGKKKILFYLGSLFSSVLAVLSSPFAIMLPALFFLYDYCRNKTNNPFEIIKIYIWRYLPFIVAFTILFAILLFATMKGGTGGVLHGHYKDNPIYTFFTMLRVFTDYLRNIFCPLWLSARYIDYVSTSFFHIKIIFSFFIIASMCYCTVRDMKKGQKFILFCFGWYLLFLLPASNIMPISTKMADRYLYLASTGIFLIFSYYLWQFLIFVQLKAKKVLVNDNNTIGPIKNKKSYNDFYIKILINSIPIVLIAILSILTIQQNITWSNSVTLWANSVKKDPRNYFALSKLGSALIDKKMYKEAIKSYSRSLQVQPEEITIYINFGKALTATGQAKKAILLYREGLRRWPTDAKLHNNIGNALGTIGNYTEAIAHFLFVIKKNSSNKIVHSNLGFYYGLNGDIKKGLIHCQKAIAIDPMFAEAYNNLGMLYALQGKNLKAIMQYKKALEINPELATVYYNIGCAFAETGKFYKAAAYFQKALSLKPNYREAQVNYKKLLRLLKTKLK